MSKILSVNYKDNTSFPKIYFYLEQLDENPTTSSKMLNLSSTTPEIFM